MRKFQFQQGRFEIMQNAKPDTQEKPITIDLDYLSGLVRTVVNNQAAEINLGVLCRVHGGLKFGSAIYQLRGTALVNAEDRPWSLIIKNHPTRGRFC
jgi:hypothetical protein